MNAREKGPAPGAARQMAWKSRPVELLLAATAFTVVAAAMILTWWSIAEDRSMTRAADATAAEALSVSVTEHVEETIRDAGNAVHAAAILLENLGGLKGNTDQVWLHRELQRELSDHTSIARMMVIDAGGRILASSAEHPLRDLVVTDQSNFRWHWENPETRAFHLGVTERSPVDARYVIPYSRAVYGASGTLTGMVVAEIDIANLRAFHERIVGVYPSILLVVNREGVRLMRFPYVEALIGRRISEQVPEEAAFRGGGSMEVRDAKDGRQYHFSYRLTKDRRLVVAIGRDLGVVMSAWRIRTQERIEILVLGAIVFLAAIALLFRYLRRLERSEESLRASEARIRSIGDNLPDGMIYQLVQEPGGRKNFTYLSAGVERLHGIPAADIQGNSDLLYDQVLPEDRHLMRAASDQSAGSLAVFNVEARIRRVDGEVRWMRFASAAHPLPGGAIRWDGIELDITDLHRANAELVQSESRFRTAMLNSPIGMALIALDARWIEVNPAFCGIVGYSRDELLATDFLTITYPEDRHAGLDLARQLVNGDSNAYRIEKRYVRKDGQPVWVQINGSVVRSPDGAALHFITQIQDTTESRDAAERMRQLNVDLEARVAERTSELTRVNKDLESFSYSVAHDLRAPLHRIAGFAGLLSDCIDKSNTEARRDIDIISREVERMGDLITNLLELARTSQAELQRTDINAAQLVAEVCESLAHLAVDRDVEWALDLPDSLRADSGLMRLVFTNLIGNALKYTRGKEPARISIARDPAHTTAAMVAICVRDNGAGFDMRYAGRLFNPFQRLHKASEFEGTGVGLANVQAIVRRHGGKVWAHSRPGEGAAFYFTLPV